MGTRCLRRLCRNLQWNLEGYEVAPEYYCPVVMRHHVSSLQMTKQVAYDPIWEANSLKLKAMNPLVATVEFPLSLDGTANSSNSAIYNARHIIIGCTTISNSSSISLQTIRSQPWMLKTDQQARLMAINETDHCVEF